MTNHHTGKPIHQMTLESRLRDRRNYYRYLTETQQHDPSWANELVNARYPQ